MKKDTWDVVKYTKENHDYYHAPFIYYNKKSYPSIIHGKCAEMLNILHGDNFKDLQDRYRYFEEGGLYGNLDSKQAEEILNDYWSKNYNLFISNKWILNKESIMNRLRIHQENEYKMNRFDVKSKEGQNLTFNSVQHALCYYQLKYLGETEKMKEFLIGGGFSKWNSREVCFWMKLYWSKYINDKKKFTIWRSLHDKHKNELIKLQNGLVSSHPT